MEGEKDRKERGGKGKKGKWSGKGRGERGKKIEVESGRGWKRGREILKEIVFWTKQELRGDSKMQALDC